MRRQVLIATILLAALAMAANGQETSGLYNPSIDMDGFLKVSQDAANQDARSFTGWRIFRKSLLGSALYV